MQLPIPLLFSRIDAVTRVQHHLIEATDRCLYIWQYSTHRGFRGGAVNSFISNFKKKPSLITRPREGIHKERAIAHAAAALEHLVDRTWVETDATLVPIPGSKTHRHPDYDDRLLRTLRLAFRHPAADIRPLIEQIHSTHADHDRPDRQSLDDLIKITRINESQARRPSRPILLLVDDVLTSGKHFKVAQRLLAQRFPGTDIRGIFLARCPPDPATPALNHSPTPAPTARTTPRSPSHSH